MPSSPSTRLRLELQAAGENLNTWGAPRLNAALSRIEEAIADWLSLTITGNVTLTASNYIEDQARAAVLNLGGTPSAAFTVTIPGVEKWYWVRNATGQIATIKTASGTGATVADGAFTAVFCDGTDCYRQEIKNVDGALSIGGALSLTGAASFSSTLNMGGQKVLSLGAPTLDADAATKKYVDDEVLSAAAGNLPGLTSNAGRLLAVNAAATGVEWSPPGAERITSSITLQSRARPYYADISAPQTLTLPASPTEGMGVIIYTGANVGVHTLTIARNGQTIGGLSENMNVTRRGVGFRCSYADSDWKVTKP